MAKELAEPYPSPPGRPGKYAFYVSRHRDDDTQVMCVVFAAPYAARKFLDVLLEDDGIVWEDECTLRSESGVVVSTKWFPVLRECVEHEYSLPEMGWEMQDPQRKWARQFRYGEQPRTAEPDAHLGKRARRVSAPSGPRASAPAGSVHVGEIAEQMGIEPRVARGALRGIMSKPAHGWNFLPSEVDEIKAKIKAALE